MDVAAPWLNLQAGAVLHDGFGELQVLGERLSAAEVRIRTRFATSGSRSEDGAKGQRGKETPPGDLDRVHLAARPAGISVGPPAAVGGDPSDQPGRPDPCRAARAWPVPEPDH